MKIFPRLFVLMAFVLCGVLYGTITPAQSDKDIGVVLGKALTAVASGNFTTAETLRDSLKDKDARALILWSQLRAGRGDWRDYTDFIRNHADWPGLKYLRRQGEAAIDSTTPAREVRDYFASQPPQTGHGAFYFAAALTRDNKTDQANREIIRAWTDFTLSKDEEQRIAKSYAKILKPHHATRADALLWKRNRAGRAAAKRMIPRLNKLHSDLVRARIALQNKSGNVDSLLAKVAASSQTNEGLLYDRFMWRIAKGRWDEAEQFLLTQTRAEVLKRGDKWASRRRGFARRAMRAGNHKTAYFLASRHGLDKGSDMADLEWLAGYLSLRFLDNPKRALSHFKIATLQVASPISVARMGYWRGRANEVLGNKKDAKTDYRLAAQYQTTFYGQLAAEKLNDSKILRDKTLAGREKVADWREVKALKSSVVRVGVLAHYATGFSGNLNLVRTFFTHVAEDLSVPDQAALADYALHLNRPYVAIKIAKQAALNGDILMRAYFPVTDLAKLDAPIPRPLVLSIARRESELDPTARSHANALGLMQVLPSTAKPVARRLGLDYSVKKLGSDWRYNARIGSAYLGEVIGRFDGSYVLGFAAYNAGPNRVKQWVEEYGNPHKKGGDFGNDIVDWIEHIPYRETRNYVMRVMESVHVYRARLKGRTPKLSVLEDLRRGF